MKALGLMFSYSPPATLVPLPKKTKVTLTEEQTVPVVEKPKESPKAPVKSKADEKKAAKSSAKAPAKGQCYQLVLLSPKEPH